MPSVLAIVSKAIFERDARSSGRIAGEGDVVPFERYVSKNKGLTPLAEDKESALFLVTVRQPEENLWLVAVMEVPSFDGEAWVTTRNAAPIRDISALKSQITFTSGTGISAKKGALGMSLQTPRVLTAADVALLRAGAGGPPNSSKGKGASGIHLNAHETSGPAPCLCRRCLGAAPETVTIDGLELFRDRAEAKGRFLWFWTPASLLKDRDAVRRAVASRLHARPERGASKKYTANLDKVFTEAGDDDDEDE